MRISFAIEYLVVRLRFYIKQQFLFVLLLFAKAQKVGKNAFAQLLLSADQPLQTNPWKEGIRIQNAIL